MFIDIYNEEKAKKVLDEIENKRKTNKYKLVVFGTKRIKTNKV